MPEKFSVRINKDYFIFSAAHFITYDGDKCERLHGHNYRVSVDVHGPLDDNEYVVDFIALRDELVQITTDLDHQMILPTNHPTIKVEESEKSVEVTFEDRRWVFPRDDCKLLPIANTTTELLAKYIGEKLIDRLKDRNISGIRGMAIGVDENEGQWGIWDWSSSISPEAG